MGYALVTQMDDSAGGSGGTRGANKLSHELNSMDHPHSSCNYSQTFYLFIYFFFEKRGVMWMRRIVCRERLGLINKPTSKS